MASKVEKLSVSLPLETLAQMEFLQKNLYHVPASACKRSQLLQWIVNDLYYSVLKEQNKLKHGTLLCEDDCAHCPESANCIYYDDKKPF